MKNMGLWIDHRKAVIVSIEEKKVTTHEVSSNMEKHTRFSSGTHSKADDQPQGSTAEDVRDRQYNNHLNDFYDQVITEIRDASSIWIFGPGEAKVELENRLRQAELGARVVGIETQDKMTTRQITAKVQMQYQ